MKKTFSMMLSVGVGFLAVQGCAGAEYTGDAEDVGVSEAAALPASCTSRQGTNASKAALAVAMGIELGRWEPLKDLEVVNGKTQLKAGVICLNSSQCKRTKAVLAQQDFTADQNRFNAGSYSSDLSSSFDRQKNWIDRLVQNNTARLPPAHKLKQVGTVSNLGVCGPHYVFQVDKLDGTALTATQAANMENTLCYYGQDAVGMSCGANPFIGFTKTQAAPCPAGKMCVAIDPDDGDAGSGTTTSAGSAPTYTLNRLWNPAPEPSKLNTACIKTSGPAGTMQSKCATLPSTCGYLYCM